MTMPQPRRYTLRPTIPVYIGWGALAPILAMSVMFTVFGVQVGLPFVLSAVFGGVGGAVSLLFHELGHVRAASHVSSVRPTSVSLIWAGAATRLEGRYVSGSEQVRVAIGGPQASFAFAFSLIAVCFLPAPLQVKELFLLLAFFNVALGLLNLFPAYPLDGYKVVAGLLWSVTGSESTARKILRRLGIGWAVIELPAALLLLVEKPLPGCLVLCAALTLVAQKRLMPRLAR
jgi:Zn-dependent protease